ncbi:MAG: recombinase RecT [Bacteroidales bacterium]|nr:recombinase RecT [Bacteroidales bacterium]
MGNINITVERLNSLGALNIVKDEAVKARFIHIYNTITNTEDGEAFYEKESRHFNRIISENEYLQKCTPFSVFTSFIDLAVCGLSVEPGARAMCYLIPRSYKIATPNGRDSYEYRCNLTISGYGELVLRINCGQIRHADNPVIVYAEDEFTFSDKDGRKSVSYSCRYPHASGHVIAGFMRITRNDGSIDYAVMFEEDWMRLQSYSGKNNKYWDKEKQAYVERPNALYSSGVNGGIDTGFLSSKIIKHAFKTYPKVKIGKSTQLETEMEEPVSMDDIYGVEDPVGNPPAQPAAFGDEPDMSGGVKVDPQVAAGQDDGAF